MVGRVDNVIAPRPGERRVALLALWLVCAAGGAQQRAVGAQAAPPLRWHAQRCGQTAGLWRLRQGAAARLICERAR